MKSTLFVLFIFWGTMAFCEDSSLDTARIWFGCLDAPFTKCGASGKLNVFGLQTDLQVDYKIKDATSALIIYTFNYPEVKRKTIYTFEFVIDEARTTDSSKMYTFKKETIVIDGKSTEYADTEKVENDFINLQMALTGLENL